MLGPHLHLEELIGEGEGNRNGCLGIWKYMEHDCITEKMKQEQSNWGKIICSSTWETVASALLRERHEV